MLRTLLSWGFFGMATAILLMVAVDRLAFGDIVPSRGLKTQPGAILEENWSDKQIVDAIYLAEGVVKAQYPYGIRSIHCETNRTCREVCRSTVKNNRRRFARAINRKSTDSSYLSYLARHYCPTNGNLSRAEKRLNQNWISNVTWFLNHPHKA